MKKALLRILRRLDDYTYVFSRKKRVLFVVEGLYGFLCQYPIICELEKLPNITVAVTSVDANIIETIETSHDDALKACFQRYYIPDTKAQYMKWNFVLDSHLNRFYPKRNSIRIGMHHGSGFGILGNKVNRVKSYDIFFGFSQAEKKFLTATDPEIFTTGRLFFPVGSPKTDAVLNQSIDREGRLKQLSLPDRQTILITSHWVDISLLAVFQEKAFAALANAFPEFNVVQTGHPWMWKMGKDSVATNSKNRFKSISDAQTSDIYSRIEFVAGEFENAFFLPNLVAEELLPIADVLIADHSSVISSYCLLDRSIVWFKHPQLEFSMPEMESLYSSASFRFSDIEELVVMCHAAVKSPELHSQGREEMRAMLYCNLGESARYAAQLIANFPACFSLDDQRWREYLG